ncbi:DUF4336 domain-containing protein [Prochlorococcus sp. MIT 1307]|uniref:DUF4336 domain-containing protein n=1 Tax=Prochlorococcus sp. MIT 1307 TaxID=3096219 RepID=UPI002A7554EB|nr:DUF4336 domain-containing protein [Prochlorococcus sp. MIT 1307]
MIKQYELLQRRDGSSPKNWAWWPLLPLYPYGRRNTLFNELIPNQIWGFEQLQGLYYVAVPVRLTVVKVPGGLMLVNPLPPTEELLRSLNKLEKEHGPVQTIVLPTASGLEHKIFLPAMARAFPEAELWICPGQWSFPLNIPLDLVGIPRRRTKVLLEDGVPHEDTCSWFSLGPLDLGLGRFQEISCFHKQSNSLLVTDALIAINNEPPAIFNFDPSPLLFHSREKGDEPLIDSLEARRKGWLRLVLFASFLRPEKLSIPSIMNILKVAFKPGLRNPKSHFGVFPFEWKEGWDKSAKDLIGYQDPKIQIPPVLERLVFPRAKDAYLKWLDQLSTLRRIRWLIPAHYSAPIPFTFRSIKLLRENISKNPWAIDKGNWRFLDTLDRTLLENGVVPSDPLAPFKD